MKYWLFIGLVATLGLQACSGAKSLTAKRWEHHLNTVYLHDLSTQNESLGEAGARLRRALEEQFAHSLFVVGEQPKKAKYELKYKITQFQEGNRLKRLATFGIDDGSRALLKVKIALYGEEGMLGAWEVQSWVRGGLTGGSQDELFSEAAEEILQHMRAY